jgi:hypothetical protein
LSEKDDHAPFLGDAEVFDGGSSHGS